MTDLLLSGDSAATGESIMDWLVDIANQLNTLQKFLRSSQAVIDWQPNALDELTELTGFVLTEAQAVNGAANDLQPVTGLVKKEEA